MRVISGIRKGHKLKAPKGMDVRPTEDRIKESVFNILRNIKSNGIVLDLFSGSGSIGIEFLSRGAKLCYFNDNSQNSISIIKENLSHTNLMDKAIVIKNDGFRVIEYFHSKNLSFDYIYIDPPFRVDKLIENLLKAISNNSILSEDGIIIIEHEKELELENKILDMIKTDCRNYGSKSITFFKKDIL